MPTGLLLAATIAAARISTINRCLGLRDSDDSISEVSILESVVSWKSIRPVLTYQTHSRQKMRGGGM